MNLDMNCQACGAPFRAGSQPEARRRKYCSVRCYRAQPQASGPQSPRWLGGRTQRRDGYVETRIAGHPRARGKRHSVLEHIVVAERALGKSLPPGVEVHHVSGDRSDNRGSNLVICQDRSYHQLLHHRARVLAEGGKPGISKRCRACDSVKPLEDYFMRRDRIDGRYSICKPCWRTYSRERWRAA